MDEIKNRHHPDDAPYDIWAARGLLTVVEGNKVNKRVFFDWFQMVRDKLDIYPLRIGYDPWHIDDSLLNMFFNEFGKDVMVPVRQGVATLSQPMKDLKAEFQAHKIVYNNNPIDKWCFLNTYVKTDINGNIQPAKGNAAKYRIDGMAAALDAYVVYKDNLEEYESLM
jgi:phage terminase large subunit-like protein